ncbi:hypothetical protein K490DRAFT_7383, partial [Saccharata proteae CBS 121410]
LYSSIKCPQGAACKLPNCIFSHDFFGNSAETDAVPNEHPSSANPRHDPKRRKVYSEEQAAIHSEPKSSKDSAIDASLKLDRKNDTHSEEEEPLHPELKSSTGKPKPKPKAATGPAVTTKIQKSEPLAPRALPNGKMPATWAARMKLLKLLHGFLVSLNNKVKESLDADVKALQMNDQAVITLALEQEENMARTGGSMYLDKSRKCCYNYKKMTLGEWVSIRRKQRDQEAGVAEGMESSKNELAGIPRAPEAPEASSLVETGLSAEEETRFLVRFIANQDKLHKFGYVSKVPTETDIAKCKEGIETAQGWEKCERCDSRFRVYPDRRDDGALTNGGKCTHHWGRLVWPQTHKMDRTRGSQPRLFSCCQMPQGSTGCTEGDTHVFKISSPNMLAAVLPFVETPPNPAAREDRAVTFDCEMGYTVNGLELIRLTACSWPDGAPLIDVLVRPLGLILDFNTRFSGVTSEQFLNAKPYTPDADPAADLRIVPDPQTARTLLLSHISPHTPLLGHGIENDLNALRLVHPTIIDTVLLFPHPKGLPIRNKLKTCVKEYLNWDIQTAGAQGHDSLEDARATGELVRWKVAREWRQLREKGWKVKDGKWFGPDGR